MIPLLLFLAAASQKGIADSPVFLDAASDPYASQYLLVTTPYGIYSLDRNSETWARITEASGLPDNRVDVLGLDEGILWAGTPKGLASADVKVNDWQTYDLPGPVSGLGFDKDYVWAGGAFGLRRFDKYTERWEEIAASRVNDVFAEEGFVWLATDSGISRYRSEFGRVEPMPAPAYQYSRIISTTSRIWFIAPGRFVSYRKETGTWSGYPGLDIRSYSASGDSLFIVSQGGVYLYEPNADAWLPFRDVEGLSRVSGVHASGSNVFFATDHGFVVYAAADRTSKTYTRSNGLQSDSIIAVCADARRYFAVSASAIEWLDIQTGIWKLERIEPAGKKREALVYLDDAGGHLRLIPGTDTRLTGRAYYSETRTFTADTSTRSGFRNTNLSLTGQHTSGRSLSLYFDDTDKDQVDYGLAYRGVQADILSRASAGHLKSEYADFDLIPQFATLGASARLQHEQHNLGLQAGRLQSRWHSEFFRGRSIEKAVLRRDVDYLKGVLFRIPGHQSLVRDTRDTVFVDDRNPATNSVATRLAVTLAGIRGDFDPLINGQDYFIDYGSQFIQFLSPRRSTDIIVLVAGGREIVIQSDSVLGEQVENVYFFGPDIVPGTFELAITDPAGLPHELSEFGLDRDHDGRVDPEFVNHDLGLLAFPDARPFPDTVYAYGASLYKMAAHFRSLSVFYNLSFAPLVRNSEAVRVDGNLLTRGADYIVDNTSGVLLFLREDIVTDFSPVEVQYSSVEREQPAWLLSAQPDIAVGTQIRLMPGFSSVDSEQLVHLSGRAETRDRRVRVITQTAMNSGYDFAHDYSVTAHRGIVSGRAEYSGFGPGFASFGAADRRYGELRHSAAASAGVQPVEQVRLDAQFRREYQADSAARRQVAQYASAKASYIDPARPNGYVLLGRDNLPDGDKTNLKAGANYEFTALDTRLKLAGIVQNSALTDSSGNGNAFEYIADAGFTLPVPVRGNIRVRRNELASPDGENRGERELRGQVNVDAVPGLFYTGSYRSRATGYLLPASQELRLENYFYNDLQVAPGRLLTRLSIVNLSFGAGTNFEEYVRELPLSRRSPFFALRPIADSGISSVNDLLTWYGKVQVNPLSNVVAWWKHTSNRSGIGRYGLPGLRPTMEDEIRAEYEPTGYGAFIADWVRHENRLFPIQTLSNVYVEWSMPWSEKLRTRLTAGGRWDRDNYLPATADESEVKAGGQALYRFSPRSYATVDLGLSRQTSRSTVTDPESVVSILPGLGVNLNLLRFLYLQFSYTGSLPLSGGATHTLSGRVTGQF